MPTASISIVAGVGIRNGVSPAPNRPADLAAISALLDRIPGASGGAADTPGSWPSDRNEWIRQVCDYVRGFQAANGMHAIDGCVDPGGGTLRLMNSLAYDPPLYAACAPAPGGRPQDLVLSLTVADVGSMAGYKALNCTGVNTSVCRRLVYCESSSIKWFGVVVPNPCPSYASIATPHIFFTPTPAQGKYYDSGYDSFESWGQLWDDYTRRIGGQIVAAGCNQVLVIPFYKNSQARDLGSFNHNWREVIAAVVQAAVYDINPYLGGSSYAYTDICCSSFSNGYSACQSFYGAASSAVSVYFDLDGQASTPPSHWRPSKSVVYSNAAPPASGNPAGKVWYVGGRWSRFPPAYSGDPHHACCRSLLYHGVFTYCG